MRLTVLCVCRYKDGEAKATFKGARTVERISEFIDEQTLPSKPAQKKESAVEVPKPAPTSWTRKPTNEAGEVLVLDAAGFADVLQGVLGPTFVKFYAPWWASRLVESLNRFS
jgi:hypothetical protein